jgi:hypothetical protein
VRGESEGQAIPGPFRRSRQQRNVGVIRRSDPPEKIICSSPWGAQDRNDLLPPLLVLAFADFAKLGRYFFFALNRKPNKEL